MIILSYIGYIMIALLLMSMMAKARPKVKEPAPGKALQEHPHGISLTFCAASFKPVRSVDGHRVWRGHWLASICSMAGIISAVAIITLLLPMHYTFTTKGVAVGEGIFYPWSDFSGFIAKGSSLKLDHPSLFGRLTLFIKPAEMDSVLKYVELYVGTK